MFSAHLLIHADVLEAVKYYSFRLEGIESQATLCYIQKSHPLWISFQAVYFQG